MSNNLSEPSFASNDHSRSLLLHKTKKKLEERMKMLKDVKGVRKVLLDNIRLRKAQNWLFQAKKDGLKSVLEQNAFSL